MKSQIVTVINYELYLTFYFVGLYGLSIFEPTRKNQYILHKYLHFWFVFKIRSVLPSETDMC